MGVDVNKARRDHLPGGIYDFCCHTLAQLADGDYLISDNSHIRADEGIAEAIGDKATSEKKIKRGSHGRYCTRFGERKNGLSNAR